MLLKSLKLRNIRSYPEQTIEFPEGSTLLAGDIGSGKSTLLMAVDFALFGLRKGELSGSDLLRHDADYGEAELDFEIDGKEFSVKRMLRRKKDSINQESGYFTANGYRKELTPTELTTLVLETIGYPQNLAAKRPLFRYTVYTPQEEMKSIIENENRIDTMLKIFDVEKYRTIRDNVQFLLTFVRGEKRHLEGYTQDLEEKKQELAEHLLYRRKLEQDSEKQEKTVHEIENELLAQKSEIDKARRLVDKYADIKSRMASARRETKMKSERIARNERDIEELRNRVSLSEASAAKLAAIAKPPLAQAEIKKSLEEAERQRDAEIARRERARSYLEGLKKTYSAGICDICGQTVHDKAGYAETIKKNEGHVSEIEKNVGAFEEKIALLKKTELDAREYERALERKADIESRIADHRSALARLLSESMDYNKEIEILDKEIKEYEKQLEGVDEAQALLERAEKKYSDMHLLYVSEERKKAAIEAQLREMEKAAEKLRAEISGKENALKKIERLNELVTWLGDHFYGLMENMEKHVMVAIQKEFDEYFQEWFSMLLGDSLTVRIDEHFSPIIEQNGYETEYRNLSGGEKTSVALAYRLAMNGVINNLMTGIKTKDLLILDEPTDGFSTDQLDRIRDVLGRLKLKQIIIVSHEPKIDTYVDNVVRIYKEEHSSRIMA